MDYDCNQAYTGTAVYESPLYGLEYTDGTVQAVSNIQKLSQPADIRFWSLKWSIRP